MMLKDSQAFFIDAHCHLDLYEGIMDAGELIKNAVSRGVGLIIANGVNPASNRKVLSLANQYPQVKAALGLYPIDALKYDDNEIDDKIKFIKNNKDNIVAIGEVGLDFKEDLSNQARQKDIFNKIIKLSIEIDKPLIVHSRKAEKETIDLIEEAGATKVIMHCFSGKFSLARRIISNKWALTIPANIKSSEHFQKIVKEAPINSLLCETDSPYLHPDKKWPNEPSNVIESYKKIAEIKALSLDEVKLKIYENYRRLFGK